MIAHAPYDGSHPLFTIGMKKLDLADWIEVDSHLGRYLDEKERSLAGRRDAVFREEPETRDAQREVLDLLAAHLPSRFSDIYRRSDTCMHIVPLDRDIALEHDDPPLLTASRLVQEDLCLMRDGPGGYRLAAASLCFPSSWSLTEKFGRTLDGLHDNVPGYGENLGPRMNRIFASMRADLPTVRFNWSLYADDALHHPEAKEKPPDWFAETDGLAAFVRVERQTLRRLPKTGDILFTIRIYLDPLEALRTHEGGPRLAAGMRDSLAALNEEQLRYKGLLESRDDIVARLEEMAEQAC